MKQYEVSVDGVREERQYIKIIKSFDTEESANEYKNNLADMSTDEIYDNADDIVVVNSEIVAKEVSKDTAKIELVEVEVNNETDSLDVDDAIDEADVTP